MTILPIVICGDPVLHNPTEVVTEPFSNLHTLIADMFETMDKANGVGLAANQVGVNKRLFVYNCYDEAEDRMRRGCVINPILTTSELPDTPPRKDGSDDEGCLSVPGYSYPTKRADWARVTGFNEHGEEITIEGEGFFARCLQHETGHLDGFLYTDMLQGRWKRAANKAIKKEKWTTAGLTWMPGVDPDPFGHDEEDEES